MLFPRPSLRRGASPDGSPLVRAISDLIRFLVLSAFRLAAVAVLLAGLVYLRLMHGPIHLAYVGDMLTGMFNEQSVRVEVQLGDLVLTLGDPGEPSGLQFVDVRVTNADGALLFAVPKLTASFDAADLAAGRPWPTRIAVIRPEARIMRAADGRFRFGLGAQPARTPEPDGGGAAGPDDALQFAAVQRVIDGFVGDIDPAPEVSRLTRIEIIDADLTYVNEAAGRAWRTSRADLLVFRAANGARARLDIGLADGDEAGAGLIVTAERRRGTGATRLSGQFERLRPEHLAEQLEQMEWLRLFDAPLSGNLAGTIHGDGRIEGLAGTLIVGAGRVLALGDEGQPIERARLGFEYEPGLRRMRVTEFDLASRALDTRLSGFVDLTEDVEGGLTGLAGQFEIARMHVELPDAFPDPLEFDGGQIVARMDFAPMQIEVGQAHLRRGDLVLDVEGVARLEDGAWRTDLRAGGRGLTVGDLLRHWPLVAATGARKWVAKNISRASIDAVVAQMRFAGGEPRLALDFTYSGLDSTYLKDMSPIRNASGRGALTLDSFNLIMDRGEVEPVAGAPVRLDGSEVRMPALKARPAPAEVTLRASGRTGSILALINEEPLHLTAKLGLDPGQIEGNSEVTAELRFPLVDNLDLNDIAIDTVAVLNDLRMPFRLPNGQVLDVAGRSIDLEATTLAMHFAGDVTVDGQPMAIDWTEAYGSGKNHRKMVFEGAAAPALLARFGIGNRNFRDGSAPMVLRLSQIGTPDYAFELSADVGPAKLVIPQLGWTKPPGQRGRLDATGIYGDGARIDSFRLDTDELRATGAAELGEGGYIRTARIDRAQYIGLADVAARVRRGDDDAFLVVLTGNRVDLALLDQLPGDGDEGSGGSGGGGVPIEMDFSLDEMVVTPRVTARPAAGIYRRSAANQRTAHLEGQVDGRVPFVADFSKTGGEPGTLEVTSAQAGELLAAARLFSGARGGVLKLKAVLAPDDVTDMTGIARISDVTVHGSGTFTSILDEGGVKDAATAAQEGGGLFFDTVRLPFEYGDGTLVLGETTAKGTLLAVKVEGTVDEKKDEVDLIGVISPAYALTGLLDSIPLIGDILSGGKGEGIVAMTFSVSGPMDEPKFSVNPLSLLAPGFLRNIFSGRNRRPDERFLEQLHREVD